MKVSLYIILILLALVQLSCGDKEDPELEVVVRYNNVILIDGTGRSCTLQKAPSSGEVAEDDVSPLKALLGGILVTWSGEGEMEILYVRFRFDGQGNQQSITISGEELGYMMLGNPGRVVMNSATVPIINSANSCNLEVGGISVGDKTKSQFGQGSVLVYGVTTKNGQQTAVQAQGFFSYQFDGIN